MSALFLEALWPFFLYCIRACSVTIIFFISTSAYSSVDFIKLDAKGNALVNQSVRYDQQPWECVLDQRTGLIWEVKKNSGLRDKTSLYSWFNSRTEQNRNESGSESFEQCQDHKACNTEDFLNRFKGRYFKNKLCGVSGWRMPLAFELLHLSDTDFIDPAINTKYFPNTQVGRYWSGDSFLKVNSSAWEVRFYSGVLDYSDKSAPRYLRLVADSPITLKATPSPLPNTTNVSPDMDYEFNGISGCDWQSQNTLNRFVDHQDGTISDLHHKLQWKKCSLGASGSNCESGDVRLLTWNELNELLKTSSDNEWRVPNIEELNSLIDLACFFPAINPLFFPNSKTYSYWSRDSYKGSGFFAWTVNFKNGIVYFALKNRARYVRLVRNLD